MQVSLCILACGQVEAVNRLIGSVRDTSEAEVEVVIGDNSPEDRERGLLRGLADIYNRVYDEELWYDGFGVVKQQIAQSASNDVILTADPDEEWKLHPRANSFFRDLEQGLCSVLRTSLRFRTDKCSATQSHGRVFSRKKMRWIGAIHEELYQRKTRENWGVLAPLTPAIAQIQHHDREYPEWYKRRKQVLYDNLLHRLYTGEMPRTGINPWWWKTYWPERLEEGVFKPTSFEAWREGK